MYVRFAEEVLLRPLAKASMAWQYPPFGTVKMKARKYIAKSAEAREAEVIETVAAKLKEKLGL